MGGIAVQASLPVRTGVPSEDVPSAWGGACGALEVPGVQASSPAPTQAKELNADTTANSGTMRFMGLLPEV